eukprot:PhF_6_TR41525/c0_g1_i1/m.62914/K15109/SLC25A20_29, CACT, CACL, CRC1; solute carrier family 25 (mitochondrial carnitine/acylcarnitine transporter), member 20/29
MFPRREPWMADFAASWITSTSTAVVTFPIDTMKVHWQARNLAPRQCIQEIGILGLYRGLQVTVLVNGMLISIIFTSYESWKRFIRNNNTTIHPLLEPCLAGYLAGIGGSFVLCPVNNVKTQLQINSGTMVQTVRNLGFRGLYRAYFAELGACSFGRASYFGSYEITKSLLVSDESERRWWHNVMASTVVGVAGWTSIFSIDLVKTKLQATPHLYKGFMDCVGQTYRAHGWRGFWTGYIMTVSRTTLNAMIALPTFDWTKSHFR